MKFSTALNLHNWNVPSFTELFAYVPASGTNPILTKGPIDIWLYLSIGWAEPAPSWWRGRSAVCKWGCRIMQMNRRWNIQVGRARRAASAVVRTNFTDRAALRSVPANRPTPNCKSIVPSFFFYSSPSRLEIAAQHFAIDLFVEWKIKISIELCYVAFISWTIHRWFAFSTLPNVFFNRLYTNCRLTPQSHSVL